MSITLSSFFPTLWGESMSLLWHENHEGLQFYSGIYPQPIAKSPKSSLATGIKTNQHRFSYTFVAENSVSGKTTYVSGYIGRDSDDFNFGSMLPPRNIALADPSLLCRLSRTSFKAQPKLHFEAV